MQYAYTEALAHHVMAAMRGGRNKESFSLWETTLFLMEMIWVQILLLIIIIIIIMSLLITDKKTSALQVRWKIVKIISFTINYVYLKIILLIKLSLKRSVFTLGALKLTLLKSYLDSLTLGNIGISGWSVLDLAFFQIFKSCFLSR